MDTVFSDASTGASQLDRRFSLVRGPARVLAFDSPFLASIPTDAYLIENAQPELPPAPGEFDVISIGGVDPGRFPAGYLEQLAHAAATGTGVLLTNGPQRGTTLEPQRLADWEATPLGPMLPVTTDPRIVVDEPPRRDVLIMIDASGSMSAARMSTAKSVASSILAEIRPVDTITIIPFDSSVSRVFGPSPGTASNMSAARSFLAGISAGGGTAPMSAIQAAAQMSGNNCAFFFISDGDFHAPTISPQCFTTSIGVAGRSFPGNLAAWGEEFTLQAGQDATGLRWAFFEPEEREEYYRTGTFMPLAIAGGDRFDAGLPLHGLAIAYPRVDAEMLSIIPDPPPDPVLAFRSDSTDTHTVGVFTGDIPASWSQNPTAQRALLAMLDHLTGWNNPERFAVALTQAGERFEVVVTVLTTADIASIPTVLDGRVTLGGEQVYPLSFQEQSTPGQFTAEFQPRLSATAQRAMLVIGEPGAALQRIPLLLPAVSGTSGQRGTESWSYGLDTGILQTVARSSGGNYLPESTPVLASTSLNLATVPLHAALVAAAAVLLAGALYTGGSRP